MALVVMVVDGVMDAVPDGTIWHRDVLSQTVQGGHPVVSYTMPAVDDISDSWLPEFPRTRATHADALPHSARPMAVVCGLQNVTRTP